MSDEAGVTAENVARQWAMIRERTPKPCFARRNFMTSAFIEVKGSRAEGMIMMPSFVVMTRRG